MVASYEEDFDAWGVASALVPKYFQPTLPIIPIPKSVPKEVADEMLAASGLFWSSPPSAGNRIRAAIERLMDERGIVKKAKTRKGGFVELTLHARIERFSEKNPELGTHLLAAKWLGNSGSHSDELTVEGVLDGLEVMNYVLTEVYEQTTAKLAKKSALINKLKGPIKKKTK